MSQRLIVRIGGGLGNQLFMYAAGYALAQRHGRELWVDTSWFQRTSFRRLELDRFGVTLREAFVDGPVRRLLPLGDTTRAVLRPVAAAVRTIAGPLLGVKIVRERDPFEMDQRLLSPLPAGDVYLYGYFQDWRYFDSCTAELRSMLQLREPPSPETAGLLDELGDGSGWASVHVRRGDYVAASPDNALSADYYRDASAIIRERRSDVKWLVFSDDPAWAKAHLDLPGTKRVVEHNRDRPWEDLILMAACRDHITANSTFSWWGSYLGQAADGIVTLPGKWFPSRSTPSGLLREGWIRVPPSIGSERV